MVLGNPRSGLSTIYHALSQHPSLQVISSDHDAYFSNDQIHAHGNPPPTQYQEQFKDLGNEVLKGEVTSGYLNHTSAISRIHRYNQDIKLVIVLRNPALRSYSHWSAAVSNDKEIRSFDVILDQLKGDASKDAMDLAPYIKDSLYAEDLSCIHQYFDPHQILYITSEDLQEDTHVSMYRIFQFIGVPYLEVDTAAQNVGSYDRSIPHNQYEYLTQAFKKDVTAVEELLGMDCSNWYNLKSLPKVYS